MEHLGLLWTELEVFAKLLLRGRNQHRREKYYQMLVRVSTVKMVAGKLAFTFRVEIITRLYSMAKVIM